MKAETNIDSGQRLNLGAGRSPLPGWQNLDRETGEEIYPLGHADGSVDVIRASHVLEHFPHGQIDDVLADWVRALRPGGILQIAVPDFESVARAYLGGVDIPVQGYVMGGQVNSDDYHKAIFDREALTDALLLAGLVGISCWESDISDCASLPISLNLQANKPPEFWPKTAAVMSMPRLSFTDNYFCAFEALPQLGIQLRKHTGAFWGQCLTRAIEESLAKFDPEYILTLDYDSVFTRQDVQALLSAASRHPYADAIAPLQASRSRSLPMLTIRGEDGGNLSQIPVESLQKELLRASTAHFGLTLIRADAIRDCPKPWFHATPDSKGEWGDARTDDDIHFWRQWEAAGKSLYIATRVPIGHAELMVRWPGRDLTATYQHPSEFWEKGKPGDVWR